MLPEYYKFHVINNSGQQLDFSGNSANEKASATLRPWKFASDGSISYGGSEVTVLTAASDLADGGNEEGSEQDNTSNKYIGVHGYFRVETDNASADGDVTLAIEWSTDGTGGTFPSDETDFDPDVHLIPVAVVNLGGAEAKAVNFEI